MLATIETRDGERFKRRRRLARNFFFIFIFHFLINMTSQECDNEISCMSFFYHALKAPNLDTVAGLAFLGRWPDILLLSL